MSLGLNGSSAGASASEFVIGTYTGTGGTVTLTFDKPPKAILIKGKIYFTINGSARSGQGIAYWMDTSTTITGMYSSSATYTESVSGHNDTVTVSGNEITLPRLVSADTDSTYAYIAFF